MALHRILVVDDSPAVRETVGILLAGEYEVQAHAASTNTWRDGCAGAAAASDHRRRAVSRRRDAAFPTGTAGAVDRRRQRPAHRRGRRSIAGADSRRASCAGGSPSCPRALHARATGPRHRAWSRPSCRPRWRGPWPKPSRTRAAAAPRGRAGRRQARRGQRHSHGARHAARSSPWRRRTSTRAR